MKIYQEKKNFYKEKSILCNNDVIYPRKFLKMCIPLSFSKKKKNIPVAWHLKITSNDLGLKITVDYV